MQQSFIAGADIGGSHITAALVDLSTNTLVPGTLTRHAIATHEEAPVIIENWARTIREAYAHFPAFTGPVQIGIAMPGPLDYEQGICYIRNQGKYESLYGLNIKSLLAAQLGITATDIRMMNDALCFLQGEVVGGAATGFTRVLGFTLGTGLGSALYSDGHTIDADLWQSPFRDGIAEDYISSRWFVQRYHTLTGGSVTGARELQEKVGKEPIAGAIFEEFAGNLACFLAGVIPQHQPQVIVLGGNIAKGYELFLPPLEATLAQQGINVPIRIATLGENAQIIGAADCWRYSLA
ncbi:MAG: ROK family protein [Candidatus Pseudobacter hemicellulosilyticus]|uniref:ROK family protein n=1 Tax=Candidatus Pseudobacter hemicellulosilyticus TaxID=3121375 RepID=A0AAJ5WXV9_9BACT|nr:MAG: ROK family protein [Pseudobacter sp.]